MENEKYTEINIYVIKLHMILVHPLATPVILLVTKITADLIQDG